MRTSGVIGYAEQRKTAPGVWEDVIVEKRFRGDILLPPTSGPDGADRIADAGQILDNVRVGNSISIVASAYHTDHVFDIRYISWQGKLWKVANIEVKPPRINLRLGGLYNGPKGIAPDTP